MSFSLPVNITVFLAFVIFVLYFIGIRDLLTNLQGNGCEMTFMFQYPQFVEISLPPEIQKFYPKYTLYGYGEGGFTEQLRKMKFKGIPVLFIPGSSGSHKQGRSLASISLRKSLNSRTPFHFDYFMISFNEEQSAIFGGVLDDQTRFTSHSIKKILSLYENNQEGKKPDSVILIGHSLGGLIAKKVFTVNGFNPHLVRLIITLSTPHKYPLIQPDHYITSFYKDLDKFWTNTSDLQHINLVSIGGGPNDVLVRSDFVYDTQANINVLTTAVPGVWLSNDHLSITWCKQLMLTIIRAIFDSVDTYTKQLSTDTKHINAVFDYHLLKRHAGKRYSTALTNRFSSFERSSKWYENLQRQFTVTEPKGLKANHYIMIRLFSDSKSEAAFIQGYNLNVRDWIFACNADLVVNSIRMCENGENLSNISEIAPVNTKLNLRRKFVYLNLHELKAKLFTHVVVRMPASEAPMSVVVDVHQPNERSIKHQVPKFYTLVPQTIIESTSEGSVYHTIQLLGLEYIYQSYVLTLQQLSCKTAKNTAVVSFIVPWANEDQHFFFDDQSTLTVKLNLLSPKPRNFDPKSYPIVKLQLDPTCRYKITIQPSIPGVFAQGARHYTLMLPAFLGTIALLTLRQQLKNLEEGKCILFLSALSSAVRRYYVIVQAILLGPKFLSIGFFLSFLPLPDFLVLQEFNLDSFLFTIMLYALAISIMYLMGAACYVTVVMSGQAIHKMALRFVGQVFSGFCNWSELVVTIIHQLPFFAVVSLISIALSTSGALALWLGTIFYFLKICNMYEGYLEDWFKYSVKLIADKVKDVVTGSIQTQTTEEDIEREMKNAIKKEHETKKNECEVEKEENEEVNEGNEEYEENEEEEGEVEEIEVEEGEEIEVEVEGEEEENEMENEEDETEKEENDTENEEEEYEAEKEVNKAENEKEKEKSEIEKELKKLKDSNDKDEEGNNESESNTVDNSSQREEKVDLLSNIHFHITVFLVWLLISCLYIPSLLMWARNYRYSIFLEKDPALIPSVIVIACGAVLWRPGVPKSCRNLYQVTSSSLFILAVASVIYASLSLYRLGYVLSASLVIVSANQILSPYFSR